MTQEKDWASTIETIMSDLADDIKNDAFEKASEKLAATKIVAAWYQDQNKGKDPTKGSGLKAYRDQINKAERTTQNGNAPGSDNAAASTARGTGPADGPGDRGADQHHGAGAERAIGSGDAVPADDHPAAGRGGGNVVALRGATSE